VTNEDSPVINDRYLLYIDILGFSDLVTADSPKVHDLYEVIASLNVHTHPSFRTIVFSDTILVYNTSAPTTAYDRHYLVMYLCEFAQDLQDRLTGRGIVFRAVLVHGEFMHYELNSVPCFFGTALIDAYRSEKQIPAIGLFMDHSLVPDSDIFQTAPFNDRYDFVFITQTLQSVENEHGGIFPIDRFSLEETDLIYVLVPEVLYLKQLSNWATSHKDAKVRQKCANTLSLFRDHYPHTLKHLEATGFELEAISPGAKWAEVESRYPESYSFAVATRNVY
jgi:hypothetical protein